MKTSPLNTLLSQLGIQDTVYFRNKENSYSFDFHIDIKNKLTSILPDAIYIFNNQPLILFFDLTSDSSRENDIHKKVWSFDNSPIAFIIKNDEVNIYNALNYIKQKDNTGKLEKINLTTEQRNQNFSFWNLQSGETWKWLQNEYFESKSKKATRKRVNERLFQNIKEVRKHLTDETKGNHLDDKHANSLILRLIFIRYLIDREIKIDDDFIEGDNINDKRKSFSILIKQPEKLNQLFTNLNEKFNGVLFKEVDIQINQEQSNYLANVFKGELQDENSLFNGYFFEIFDFSIIPVEVISGIYESLIDEETRKLDSAVYTPSYLVDYVLSDTVDKFLENSPSSDCSIFEVAVGSGIFLVQSLRRMIEKEINLNPEHTNEKFSLKIREIAEKNLFGIDVNPEALKITCFSIYIALLDYQKPKDINVYHFPELIGRNLFEANFFDSKHEFNEIIKEIRPKYILGNPPWKRKKDDSIHTAWLKENKKTVGNYEIAQSFLLRVKDFMSYGTGAALIVTSTMFYNISKTNKKFKHEFLSTYCIDKFFDLSAVKQSLFETQESPTTIVFFNLSHEKEYLSNILIHQSLKVNSFLKNFKMLVIEKFDRKNISQKHFIEYDWMFKVALYGNTLDLEFLKKIKSKGSSLLKKIDNKTIYAGAGIKSNTGTNFAEELINLPLIENSDIQEFYTPVTDSNKILKPEDVWYESGRKKQLFFGNKILIKEQAKDWSRLVISYNNQNSVYKNGVNGISSQDNNDLKFIYSLLISNIYTYYIFLISSGWGVATRPQTRWKEEYLSFPIVETDSEVKSDLITRVNTLLQDYNEFYNSFNLGEPTVNQQVLFDINYIANNLYSVNKHEEALIDYVMNVSRYQFQESKQQFFTKKIDGDKDFLEKYINVYIDEFSKIYNDEYIQVEVYPLNYFIALNFVFSDKPNEENIVYPDKTNEKDVLKRLANNLSIEQITNTSDANKNLFIQKDIKGFENDSFYIIKPNEYKCWHSAMAWYDVAEFKAKIQEAELNNLNHSDNGF